MDIVTSIIAGFVIFTTLGNMSQELDIPIDEVAQKGGYKALKWTIELRLIYF